MATVVNVKVKYIRDNGMYKNLKEWCEDPQNVYIGRRGIVFIDGERYPKKDSEWANPFKISDDCSREESLKKYKVHLKEKLKDKEAVKRFLKLQGKNLGCWCVEIPSGISLSPNSTSSKDSPKGTSSKDSVCHGHIIQKFLNKIIEYKLKNKLN